MIRNPEIQFASADAIAAFQQERLREEIAYLYENSPYYRRMFDHCGARPGDIRTQEDLRRLPVTTKTDLQLHPQDFICVPRSRIIDYVTTSGTLGDPVTFASRRRTSTGWPTTKPNPSPRRDARRRTCCS